MKVDNSVPNPLASLVTPPVRDTAGVSPDVVSGSEAAAKPDSAAKQDPKAEANGAPSRNPRSIRPEDLTDAIKKMNETVKIFNRSLEFKVAHSGRVVVKVIDSDSGEIIRQIPPETLLDMYDSMNKFVGLLVDRKV